jgi:hypothetical protein
VLYPNEYGVPFTYHGRPLIRSNGRFASHPELQALFERASEVMRGRVGMVASARVRVLPPHSRIKPHKDHLDKLPGLRRYQLAMQCDDQAVFTIRTGATAAERCTFCPGELWHVDLRNRTHFVVNNSDLPRVVMIIECFTGADGAE